MHISTEKACWDEATLLHGKMPTEGVPHSQALESGGSKIRFELTGSAVSCLLILPTKVAS